MKPELVLDAQALLGEGPCWDEALGVLWWVDIVGQRLHKFNPVTGNDEAYPLDQQVGTVVPWMEKRVVVALQDGLYAFGLDDRRLELIVRHEDGRPDNRFNDGKCDPMGRLWAGTLNLQGERETGALYCYDPHSGLRRKRMNISVSNGLGWSPDYKQMYWIDSPTREVTAFDYDAAAGNISNPRPSIRFGEGQGVPDGMTVDEEGMLWVAHWDGGQVSRWDPHIGRQLESIKLPVPRVTSCAFGGPDRRDLYITTARIRLDEAELRQYPLSGGIFRVRTAFRGMPAFPFGGLAAASGEGAAVGRREAQERGQSDCFG